jgi:hypothetical protein
LKASKLPYEEAFASQKLPPVPSSLSASIDAMVCAQASARAFTAAANDHVSLETANGRGATKPICSRLLATPVWFGSASAAGIDCCALAMTWFRCREA